MAAFNLKWRASPIFSISKGSCNTISKFHKYSLLYTIDRWVCERKFGLEPRYSQQKNVKKCFHNLDPDPDLTKVDGPATLAWDWSRYWFDWSWPAPSRSTDSGQSHVVQRNYSFLDNEPLDFYYTVYQMKN